MSLILAIEPDRRQAARLGELVRRRLGAQLVHAATTERALEVIGNRVPDLVLVPSLLSPQEDATLAGALRVIAAAANVRMLTIPLLADAEQPAKSRGVLGKWRKSAAKTAAGCDPGVFADQIATYLAEAEAERAAAAADAADKTDAITSAVSEPAPPAATELPDVDLALPVSVVTPAAAAAIEEPSAVLETPMVAQAPVAAETFNAPEAPDAPDAPDAPAAPAHRTAPDAPVAPLAPDAPESEFIIEPEPVVEAIAAPMTVEEPPAAPVMEASAEPIAHEKQVDSKSAVDAVLAPLLRDLVSRWRKPRVEPIAAEPIASPPIVAEPAESESPVAQSEQATVAPPPAIETPVIAAASTDAPALESATTDEDYDPIAELITHYKIADATLPVRQSPATAPAAPVAAAAAAAPAHRTAPDAPAHRTAPVAPGAPAAPIAPGLSQSELDQLFLAHGGGADFLFEEEAPVQEAAMAGEPVAPSPALAPPVAAASPAAAAPTRAEKPEWLALIESLRADIERLKQERANPAEAAAAVATATVTPPHVATVEEEFEEALARPANVAPFPDAASRKPPRRPATDGFINTPKKRGPKPIRDQWGLFDPQQCGFAALKAKLEEISAAREEASA